VADKLDVPLRIWWEPNPSCNCVFHDLFEPTLDRFDPIMVNAAKYLRQADSLYKTSTNILIKNDHIINTANDLKYDVLIMGANQPIRIDKERVDDVTKDFQQSLQKLKIKESISDIINGFQLSNAVGIHVGRGHVVKRALLGIKTDIDRYIPLELYFNEIDKLDQNTRIFVSCEDEKDQIAFIERYDTRVIYKDGEKSRCTANGLVEAFINIILLSKCNHIIDGRSSFSHVAAWCGNITIKELKNKDGILPPQPEEGLICPEN
jgi:hypothetical protein